MQRYKVQFVLMVAVLGIFPAAYAASPEAAVTGVVRNAQGVAQMGALVQLLNRGTPAGSAFTDVHGRYLIANVDPGKYQIRASATLFVPAQRQNLQLRSGARTIVNLTLSALYDTTAWLPAERRRADEPEDDWKWTLRSAVNRPILRMIDDGNIVLISSSAVEQRASRSAAKGAVLGGDGGFGSGGVHTVLTLDRVLDDGSDVIFRADMGSMATAPNGRPSTGMQTGYQRRLGVGGAAKMMVSYQAHPEMVAGDASGMNVMQMATAQKMELGDNVELEAGNALSVIEAGGYGVASRPFLRVRVHPASHWDVGYRMATARGFQGFNGMDAVQPELAPAAYYRGHLAIENGLHQEVSLTRSAGKAIVQVAYYHDGLDTTILAGTGAVGNSGAMSGAMVDTSNGSFRMLARGYNTNGMSFTVTQAFTPAMSVAFEYSTGAGLAMGEGRSLADAVSSLRTSSGQTAAVALRDRITRSGTMVRMAYRWEGARFVTAVDPYAPFADQAYFSAYVRQPLHCGNLLPPGLEATVDVTNLLAQGYHPVFSADGKTLYLTQAPRVVQAGIDFNF